LVPAPSRQRITTNRGCIQAAKLRTLVPAGGMSTCTVKRCRSYVPTNISLCIILVTKEDTCTYTHSELALHINTMIHRRNVDMLRGLSGSASPSHVTKNGSPVIVPTLDLVGRELSGSASKQVYPSPPARDWCDLVVLKLLLSCDRLLRPLPSLRAPASTSFEVQYPPPSKPSVFSSSSTSECISSPFSLLLISLSACSFSEDVVLLCGCSDMLLSIFMHSLKSTRYAVE
jgi:hypothetical protein